MKNCVRVMDLSNIVINALREDIGTADITTNAVVPPDKCVKAALLAKEDCVICGLNIARFVFKTHDKSIRFKPAVAEGSWVRKGKTLAFVSGRARSILTAERVALNFLSYLSGISTKTHMFVSALKPFRAKIVDTRKTTPGLRILEKYAVRIGGGFNHRMSLDEMYLIKDNHLQVIGGIKGVRGLSRRHKLEIEVKNLEEFRQALEINPDIIMLDNMSIKDMKRAVSMRDSRLRTPESGLKLEASGGITLKNLSKVASCGVDIISVGELTHSVSSIDISLEILQ